MKNAIYKFNSTEANHFITDEILNRTDIGKDAVHKGIYITRIDNTYDIYKLANYEASFNAGNYIDKIPRTADMKFFQIFSGKVAELHVLWDCTSNFKDEVIRGVKLFGKADDGIDLKLKKIGNVQVKYFHWENNDPYVNIYLPEYKKYKNCKLFVVRHPVFDKNYRPFKNNQYKQRPSFVPYSPYAVWTMLDVDLKKMINDKMSKICFDQKSICSHKNPYVDYVQRKYYIEYL